MARRSLLLACALCAAVAAQEPREVPVDREPLHKRVFENDYARVFRVEVPPRKQTLVHRHALDYIVVTIGDADVTNAVVGKEPRRWPSKDGDVTFVEAADEKSFAHKAINNADRPFVNYTIELKKPKAMLVGCREAPCFRLPAYKVEYRSSDWEVDRGKHAWWCEPLRPCLLVTWFREKAKTEVRYVSSTPSVDCAWQHKLGAAKGPPNRRYLQLRILPWGQE